MNVENCEGCYFKSPIRHDDGKVVCSSTGSLIEEAKVCLIEGPMIRAPRTPGELRVLIEETQRRWRREGQVPKVIALVK